MTHKQRKWIQKTKSRPPGLRGRTGQTFSSRNASIKQDYDGRRRFVIFNTTIQRNGYVHRGHKGWRQDAVDKRSEGSRKGQADNLWIPRRSGHIYKGPSPLGGTLSHKHSPTPSLTGSPRHQWRNRPIQLPGRHQLQQLPQWLHLQLFRRVSPHVNTRSFTENYNISRDTGSVLSVDVLSRVVWSLFELLKQNIRCTQPNIFDILASSNNIIQSFWQTISTPWQREAQSRSYFTWLTDKKSSNTQAKLLYSSPFKSHQTLPGFPLQLPDLCEVAPVHTLLP